MNRLRALVERAHANGLWIRFYTLDGATKAQLSCNGWFHDYNFGSLDKLLAYAGARRSPLMSIISHRISTSWSRREIHRGTTSKAR